ncbi:MAG: VOC family protein [candidate division NC10 bacterium]|nr:VOC family protein [candidate division NC10 bacterium]
MTGLSSAFLLVSNLARSVHFYRELLGRSPASEDMRHARFELGPISLTIHEDLTPAEVSVWKIDPEPERRGWGAYLTFLTDDLEETYRRLVGIGAEILTTPNVTPWGTRTFTTKDPDGYLLELCQRG